MVTPEESSYPIRITHLLKNVTCKWQVSISNAILFQAKEKDSAVNSTFSWVQDYSSFKDALAKAEDIESKALVPTYIEFVVRDNTSGPAKSIRIVDCIAAKMELLLIYSGS